MGAATDNMEQMQVMQMMAPGGAPPTINRNICACWQGLQCPMLPMTGCCHVGACCGHSVCWTGCTQMIVVPCIAGCAGKMPIAAGSWCCFHAGCGFHKILQCELCCAELDCHQPGEHGFSCKKPEFTCNTDLLSCSCDSPEDFIKHFFMQCGVCCCHWWCTKQACFGGYCKDMSQCHQLSWCSQFCCCFATDCGLSHLQWCGCFCCSTVFMCCDKCLNPPITALPMSMRGPGEWLIKNAATDPRMAALSGLMAQPMAGPGLATRH